MLFALEYKGLRFVGMNIYTTLYHIYIEQYILLIAGMFIFYFNDTFAYSRINFHQSLEEIWESISINFGNNEQSFLSQ